MNEPTLEKMLEELVNGGEEIRRFAAEELGETGDSDAVPGLTAALRDDSVAVREAAADALIAIGGEPVCHAMLPLLDDDDAAVRNLALEVFQRLWAHAIPACIELYASSSHDLRKIAVDTLGKIEETRKSEGFSTLVSALDDPNINVAQAACEALGRIGGKDAVKALADHVGRHAWMDSTIFLSLAKIGSPEAKKELEKVRPEKLEPDILYALKAAREMIK